MDDARLADARYDAARERSAAFMAEAGWDTAPDGDEPDHAPVAADPRTTAA